MNRVYIFIAISLILPIMGTADVTEIIPEKLRDDQQKRFSKAENFFDRYEGDLREGNKKSFYQLYDPYFGIESSSSLDVFSRLAYSKPCFDKPWKVLHFKELKKKKKPCAWLNSISPKKRKRICSPSVSDADIICPDSCLGLCPCNDFEHFEFEVDGKIRNCKWMTQMKFRNRKLYCKKNAQAAESCYDSCSGWCVRKSLERVIEYGTDVPSNIRDPTMNPTSYPSQNPTISNDNTSNKKSSIITTVSKPTSITLSFDGTILLIGEWGGSGDASKASVYSRTSPTDISWHQVGETLLPPTTPNDFGGATAVSKDGTVLVVGGAFYSLPTMEWVGLVRMYKYAVDGSGVRWEQLGQDLYGKTEMALFGSSVALDGDGTTCIIGAIGESYGYYDGNENDKGYAVIFKYQAEVNAWEQRGAELVGIQEGDYFGEAVDISEDGKVAVVGAKEGGYVISYQWDDVSSQYFQRGSTLRKVDSEFGRALSLSASGSVLAVGDRRYNGTKGGVSTFKWDPDKLEWYEMGPVISGLQNRDLAGTSVALSDDGLILVVGTGHYDSVIRVMEWQNNQWIQKGESVEGGAWSAVTISGDGKTFAVGIETQYYSNYYDRKGKVTIYELA